jgi:hypothetical protein
MKTSCSITESFSLTTILFKPTRGCRIQQRTDVDVFFKNSLKLSKYTESEMWCGSHIIISRPFWLSNENSPYELKYSDQTMDSKLSTQCSNTVTQTMELKLSKQSLSHQGVRTGTYIHSQHIYVKEQTFKICMFTTCQDLFDGLVIINCVNDNLYVHFCT